MNNEFQNLQEIDSEVTAMWKLQRMGKFTSSTINKLMSVGSRPMTEAELAARPVGPKGGLLDKRTTVSEGFGEGAITHIYKKCGEVLTQEANEATGPAVKWGEMYEEDLMRMFGKLHNKEIEYFGKANPVFTEYDKHPDHAGGSLDGFIPAENAIVEGKCPFESGNHAEVLHLITTGKFNLKAYDPEYYGQVQFNIHIKKAAYAYFVSYDPRVINYLYSIAAIRIERDEDYINALLPRLDAAIDTKISFLKGIGYEYASEETIAA